MLLNLADFIVDYQNKHKFLIKDCLPYSASLDTQEFDISISIDEDQIDAELQASDVIWPRGYCEGICFYRAFAEWLPLHNAFLLHSACFDVDGTGVAFAAHSGTGKTTHMNLWQQLLGDHMTIVNGDKPIVRFFDDPVGAIHESPAGDGTDSRSIHESTLQTENPIGNFPFAYGTPWNGKEHLGCNMRTPLRHLCFIERAEQNSCEPMTDTSEAIVRIFNQVYMPKDPAATKKTMELIDRLMNSVQLWKIKCNMDPSAAEVAYNTIFGK